MPPEVTVERHSSRRTAALALKAHHVARVARWHACLGHDTENGPKRLPSNWPAVLRHQGSSICVLFKTRSWGLPAPFCPRSVHSPPSDVTNVCCVLPRVFKGSSGCRGLSPAASDSPPHGPGKMLRFDFCNRLARHVHPAESFDARGDPTPCEAVARPTETNPRRAARVMRCLTTPRGASVIELHVSTSPSCEGDREGRVRTDPAGPRSRTPRFTPPNVRRFLPLAGRAQLPLALFSRRLRHPQEGKCLYAAGATAPAFPSRNMGVGAHRAPSIEGCSLDPTLARLASDVNLSPIPKGFADPGPASDALSLFRTL